MSVRPNVIPDTEVVFRQLRNAARDMNDAWSRPDKVSRYFGEFVILTQKLTDVMRKEYRRETGKQWEAKGFTGWTPVTKLFKLLRNADLHEAPIRMKVATLSSFRATLIDPHAPPDLALCVQWELDLGSPFDTRMPDDSVELKYIEVAGKKVLIERLNPETQYRTYTIHSVDSEIKDQLYVIGTHCVSNLTIQCEMVLAEYFKFYCHEVGREYTLED